LRAIRPYCFAEAFGYGIEILGDRTKDRWWWLSVRQPACGDVGIDATVGTGLGVVFTPEARIRDQGLGDLAGVSDGALQHGNQVLNFQAPADLASWLAANAAPVSEVQMPHTPAGAGAPERRSPCC
jgi:hypothetical protein